MAYQLCGIPEPASPVNDGVCKADLNGIFPCAGELQELLRDSRALALGAAVAMAEAVRQVEVHCAERGRAVALVWNLYTAAMSSTLGDSSLLRKSQTAPVQVL